MLNVTSQTISLKIVFFVLIVLNVENEWTILECAKRRGFITSKTW